MKPDLVFKKARAGMVDLLFCCAGHFRGEFVVGISGVGVVRIRIATEKCTITNSATQQVVNRFLGDLPRDVPKRNVDRGIRVPIAQMFRIAEVERFF